MKISREKLKDILPEFEVLYNEHFKITASNQELFKSDVDWNAYLNLEKLEWLHLICIRDLGKLVGYMWFLTCPNPVYKSTPTAIMEKYYVSKDYWGNGLGSMLVSEMENWSKELGVQRVIGSTKISQGEASIKMMTNAGYVPIETNWEKVL